MEDASQSRPVDPDLVLQVGGRRECGDGAELRVPHVLVVAGLRADVGGGVAEGDEGPLVERQRAEAARGEEEVGGQVEEHRVQREGAVDGVGEVGDAEGGRVGEGVDDVQLHEGQHGEVGDLVLRGADGEQQDGRQPGEGVDARDLVQQRLPAGRARHQQKRERVVLRRERVRLLRRGQRVAEHQRSVMHRVRIRRR